MYSALVHDKKRKVSREHEKLLQRYRDSNPNIQSQSLLCYLYTIPLYGFLPTDVIISNRLRFVNTFLKFKITIVQWNSVTNPATGKKDPKKITIKNIGPVSKYDDGKPGFIERFKASYAAGNPILDELKNYVNKR